MTQPHPTVLLVEDHEDSRMMYAEYLRVSFEVLEAGDGQSAWEIIERTPPAIVVTDLALPRVDGYQLIERIRSDERFRDMPIVALSGYSGRPPAAGSAATWDLELQKPCLPEQLLDAIASLTSDRKSRG
jgi:CheY-like chemotaxis protein